MGYEPRWPFRSGDLSSVYPVVCRRPPVPDWVRRRVTTPDDDFIDLDWLKSGASRAVVLLHGLEGSSGSGYMRGMAGAFARRGWDVVAMNFRGCSGEPNRQRGSYHSGATDDVEHVLRHLGPHYDSLAAIGFSLGGNMLLKYLGEDPGRGRETLAAAVAFSAPVDLASSAEELVRRRNVLYSERFLRKLKRKIREKATRYPDLDTRPLRAIRNLIDFDDRYTAPLHGFRDAADYYARASARPTLADIRVPTLLVNAVDDPMLAPPSFPRDISTDAFTFEASRYGGHVGFVEVGREYWSEARGVRFVEGNVAR